MKITPTIYIKPLRINSYFTFYSSTQRFIYIIICIKEKLTLRLNFLQVMYLYLLLELFIFNAQKFKYLNLYTKHDNYQEIA